MSRVAPSGPVDTAPATPLAVRRSPSGGAIRDGFCDAFSDIVLGGACAGCRRPGRTLCAECAAEVAAWTPRPVARPGFGPAVAATDYEGLAADLLVAHKEHGAVQLSAPLGAALARAVLLTVPNDHEAMAWARTPKVILVPVPSSRPARRRRGYDHTLRLARAAARHLRYSGVDADVLPLLERAHPVRDQAELGLDERAANQTGSMRVRARRGPPAGALVVVVDDIITTGATVREAVRALGAAGVGVRLVAAVAQTPRRTPARSPGTRAPGRGASAAFHGAGTWGAGGGAGQSERGRPVSGPHASIMAQNSGSTSTNNHFRKSSRNP